MTEISMILLSHRKHNNYLIYNKKMSSHNHVHSVRLRINFVQLLLYVWSARCVSDRSAPVLHQRGVGEVLSARGNGRHRLLLPRPLRIDLVRTHMSTDSSSLSMGGVDVVCLSVQTVLSVWSLDHFHLPNHTLRCTHPQWVRFRCSETGKSPMTDTRKRRNWMRVSQDQ